MAATEVILLVVSVLDNCVKGYEFFMSVADMPESCADRQASLSITYSLLRDWAESARVVVEQGEGVGLGASEFGIVKSLSVISSLLLQLREKCGKYEQFRPNHGDDRDDADPAATTRQILASICTEASVYTEDWNEMPKSPGFWTKVRKLAMGVGMTVAQPRRIQWVLKDEKEFDEILVRLKNLTDGLWDLMAGQRLKSVERTTMRSFMDIVQLKSTVEELAPLIRATALLIRQQGHGEQSELVMLETLAGFKQLTLTLRSAPGQQDVGKEIKADQIKGIINRDSFGAFASATYRGEDVWIDWKPYPPVEEPTKDPVYNDIKNRTGQLSALLESRKPSAFCAPDCLGYFKNKDLPCFGWVFATLPAVAKGTVPKTLRWLLSNLAKRPSLTERIALASRLATCILYLHAVNWIHKDLRSSNIVFLHDTARHGLGDPVLAGFSLARPGTDGTLEPPRGVAERDIYLWHRNQGISPDNARPTKTSDMYSLGVVLLEIAHWAPIESIMGLDLSKATLDETKGIRGQLMDTDMANVSGVAGEKYRNAVNACIDGIEGWGFNEADDQNEPENGVKLQRLYMERVVQELKGLSI